MSIWGQIMLQDSNSALMELMINVTWQLFGFTFFL